MVMTAAILAEICSALPLSGSIYIWAAVSAGPKYGRFFGFIVAWWSCTAWMTVAAFSSQVYTARGLTRHTRPDDHIIDNRQLYRVSDGSMGGRFSWRHGKR